MNIGIYGYGNLGRAVEIVAADMRDVSVRAVFTRRDPDGLRTLSAPAYDRLCATEFKDEIDCMLLCGSSLNDIRQDAIELAEHFNTVDSYDVHSSIAEHIDSVSRVAEPARHTSVVSAGWDPGVLSIFRLYSKSILPGCEVNTFWGKGVSQGHSAAIRRIDGVKRAVQYTIPRTDALILAQSGKTVKREMRHRRECYVVAESGRECEIEEKIKSMPEYFLGYETDVHFIDEEEFIREHIQMKHKGECIAFGMSGVYREHSTRATLKLELDSNPEFTASVMLAYAFACVGLNKEEKYGAYSVFDIAPSYLARTNDYISYI